MTELIVFSVLVLFLAVRIFRYVAIQYTSMVSLSSALRLGCHSPAPSPNSPTS